MPFQFNPDEYKNRFVAKIILSELKKSDNNPEQEVLNLILLRLKPNATRTDWEPIETGYQCNIPGCFEIKPWHTHVRYYESPFAGSPAHKFVMSLQQKGNFNLTRPEVLKDQIFNWEEEIIPERRNPQGGLYKEQRNYYVAGPAELNPAHTQPATTNGTVGATNGDNGELPWDAPVAAPANPAVPASSPATTVAVADAPVMTYEEGVIALAAFMDGKTKEEVRNHIAQTPELRKTPNLFLAFQTNKMGDDLKTIGIVEGDDGKYHVQA
jgi:hypothetical protein